MTCPACQAENAPAATACIACGEALGAQSPTMATGTTFAGRYEIQGALGRGGMGMVYRARDRELREVVALKMIRPDMARHQHMERRFRSEIKLARRVRHPNVCSIYGDGEDHGVLYICMELVDGTDLREVVRPSGVHPRADAFDIAIQVAEGLKAIHDVGIIHRDLKTANIMRDRRGVVRLMDFGIAKKSRAEDTTAATATGQVLGTPEYMSPEQIRGEKVDFRTDVYALGIVVYEIFTGSVPFRGETPVATIFKHLQEPPPLPTRGPGALPRSLVPVLRRALAKAPDARFANAGEMLEALRRARDEHGGDPDPVDQSVPLEDLAEADTRGGTSGTADAATTREWSGREPAAGPTMPAGDPTVLARATTRPSFYMTVLAIAAVMAAAVAFMMSITRSRKPSVGRDTAVEEAVSRASGTAVAPASLASATPLVPAAVTSPAPPAAAVKAARPGPRPSPRPRSAEAVIYDEKDVDVHPMKLTGAAPSYPNDAPRLYAGDRLSVTFAFVITEKGDVTDIELLEGTTNASPVALAVVSVVSRWKFTPALKKGAPVRVRVTRRHTFLGAGGAPPAREASPAGERKEPLVPR